MRDSSEKAALGYKQNFISAKGGAFYCTARYFCRTCVYLCRKKEREYSGIYYLRYCLTVLIPRLLACIKGIKAFLMRLITGTEFGRKYADDLALRGSIGIRQGMAVNFIYVIFRMTAGIYYASV